jgi:glycosyltransferase involved in cell wall biosynthesis
VVKSSAADISVIIPFYNRETYIDEAVQSVLAQTLKPLEIIIVNDCSQESSRRFLDRYAKVCTILDLPKNVGLAGARNAAIRVTRGRFIALLDDDDIWLPQKLEVQYRYIMEHPECSGVHTAVWLILSGRPDVRYKNFDPAPLPLSQGLTHRQWVIPSTLLIRTQAVRAVGGFDPWFRENEDRDFVIRCCAAGYRLEGIDEALVRFRRTGHEHLAGRPLRMFKSHMKVCWKHRALYRRVFGFRGMLDFFLESACLVIGGYIKDKELAWGKQTWLSAGMAWRIDQWRQVNYDVRPEYVDPITCEALGIS